MHTATNPLTSEAARDQSIFRPGFLCEQTTVVAVAPSMRGARACSTFVASVPSQCPESRGPTPVVKLFSGPGSTVH